MLLLTRNELRAAEAAAEENSSVFAMMENAAAALARHIEKCYAAAGTLLFLCGKGKNGGDGLAAARILREKGSQTVCLVPESGLGREAAFFLNAYEVAGGVVLPLTPDVLTQMLSEKPGLVIDALLGTGLSRPVEGLLASCIELVNQSGGPVVSVDIASGLDANSGAIQGAAICAAETVCFTAARPGQIFYPGCDNTGRLYVYDVGISAEGTLWAAGDGLVCKALPPRPKESHKGHYGRIALFCGAALYTGAARLAALAAVRSGAGLVSVGVPGPAYPIVASALVEAMTYPLPDEEGLFAESACPKAECYAKEADAVLCGCGIGRSAGAFLLARRVLSAAACPVVLDADGINAFASHIDVLQEEARRKPVILTPHDGELARLTGRPVPSCYGERLAFARETARALNVILVMKGHKTITAAPDGRAYINTSGNPGMARGGSGDVLAGMIAALAGRKGADPVIAAAAGVYLHGRAGDLACARFGEVGMTPSDMLLLLPETILACLRRA